MLAAIVIVCAVTSADKCVVIAAEPVFQTQEACQKQAQDFLDANGRYLKGKFHGDYAAHVWCREIVGTES